MIWTDLVKEDLVVLAWEELHRRKSASRGRRGGGKGAGKWVEVRKDKRNPEPSSPKRLVG